MDLTLRVRGRVVVDALAPFLAQHHKVLDIGCGNGIVSEQIRNYFKCDLTGTDVLNYLRTDTPFRRICDGSIDGGPGEFDVGLFIDALHHIELDRQVQAVREGLRVCRQILVFEAKPTPITKGIDVVMNYFHNPNMAVPLAHRTLGGWEHLFHEAGIDCLAVIVRRPFWVYPIDNFLFALQLAKPLTFEA